MGDMSSVNGMRSWVCVSQFILARVEVFWAWLKYFLALLNYSLASDNFFSVGQDFLVRVNFFFGVGQIGQKANLKQVGFSLKVDYLETARKVEGLS